MSRPAAQDFAEAIQNPSLCFADPDLKDSTVVCNPLGLPKVVSGQFACVFRLKYSRGEWAIRCFLRDIPDLASRYATIGRELNGAMLSYTTSFRYIERGIRVKGQWHPILVMDWLSGVLLNDYLHQRREDKAALTALADHFCHMANAMRDAGIAHGDLQHGNVLIVQDRIILIDYDGMFVKSMATGKGYELGHRNYQHPERRDFDFGPDIDRFSIWVIVLSIIALTIDPTLWEELNGGDDALLFRADDFKNPPSSKAFAVLRSRKNQNLDRIVEQLESLCYSDTSALPTIYRSVFDLTASHSGWSSQGGGTWLNDHVQPNPHPILPTPKISPDAASWLVDHVVSSAPKVNPTRVPKVVVFMVVAALAPLLILVDPLTAFASFEVVVALQSFLLLGSILMIRSAYQSDPAAREAERLRIARKAGGKRVTEIEQRQHLADSRFASERNKKQTGRTDHDSALSRIRNQCDLEKKRVRFALDAEKYKFLQGKQSLDALEARDIQMIEGRFQSKASAERSEVSRLEGQRDAELATALATMQKQHLARHLQGRSLRDASISGIGEKLRERLMHSGIRTADDASRYRVSAVAGIGPQKAAAVAAWRGQIENAAKQTQPRSLDINTKYNIENRFASQITPRRGALASIESSRQGEIDQVRTSIRLKRQSLQQEFQQAEKQHQVEVGKVDMASSTAIEAEKVKLLNAEKLVEQTLAQMDKARASIRRELDSAKYQLEVLQKQERFASGLTLRRWLLFQLVG